jgi:hypothetical protein
MDAASQLNKVLQDLGFLNPASVLRELDRVFVSEMPPLWRIKVRGANTKL